MSRLLPLLAPGDDPPIQLERADSLDTTGNQLWTAARVLHRCLASLPADSEFAVLRRRGARILELGAGIGWLACAIALHDGVTVCATDQHAQLALLARNVALNAPQWQSAGSQVAVQQLDFFDEHATAQLAHSVASWSLVVASDVVYTLALANAFAQTVARILDTDSATMLYAHTFGRFTDVDQVLIEKLQANGVVVSLLADGKEEALSTQWVAGDFELFADQITRVLILRRAS